MTPSEVYALPALRSVPWHQSVHAGRFLDLPHLLSGMRELRERHGLDDALSFQPKVSEHLPEGGTLELVAVVWRGRPVGLVKCVDRFAERVVTDIDGWKEARDHVDALLPRDAAARLDLFPAAAVPPALMDLEGLRTVAGGEGLRLAMGGHLDAMGRLIYDRDAFSAAFERLIRPHFMGGPEFHLGIVGRRMNALACDCVVEALTGADRTAVLGIGPAPDDDGIGCALDWIAVLCSTDEGTYLVGVPAGTRCRHFAWTRMIGCVRVGDREMYARILDGSLSPVTALEGVRWHPLRGAPEQDYDEEAA